MSGPNGRPSIVGQNTGPEAPYPLTMEGKVISGFGRGSKELGIPTANLPVDEKATPWIADAKSGVYFGYASLLTPAATDFKVYPMVMSIGYNPFYKNTVRSAEVHILHSFEQDFYDAHMRLLITGFIREEKDYKSLEALVEDINFDCTVTKNSLDRQGWRPKGVEVVDGKGADGDLDVAWLVKPL
ncbi:riboflavin kinase [Emericellopsis atlantica]|uniref:Riboflavin kinase n=1 Tax=Emericellopsis atlantica TaxID=2614577 RepID=A0A9P8CLC1_9HYPO|nr:riboflavin kinase [Emericellopsis atlantica]KAG9251459.1 riboflavin kinase [Emericellopsis atlantica]